MLITLLYHKVENLDLFEKNLLKLSQTYTIVLPGNKLKRGINICLTFDDGFYNFYHLIFPILVKLQIPCVLAVCPKFINDKSKKHWKQRLCLPSFFDKHNSDAFCTWSELKQMQKSSLVQIASHSYSHLNLLFENVNLENEIITSKKILEDKLNTFISTFVYPYGKFNKKIHKEVKKHYPFVMRIGSSINFSWQNFSGLIYRIVCDKQPKPIFRRRFFSYYFNYLVHSFRKR